MLRRYRDPKKGVSGVCFRRRSSPCLFILGTSVWRIFSGQRVISGLVLIRPARYGTYCINFCIIINKITNKSIRLRPVCALQTVTRKRRYIYPIPSGEGPGTPGGGGGPVGRCDRPPGGAAGRGGHPPLGGAQNPTLCPGNWHPPGGGQKRRNLALYILVGSSQERVAYHPRCFIWSPGPPPGTPPYHPLFPGDY